MQSIREHRKKTGLDFFPIWESWNSRFFFLEFPIFLKSEIKLRSLSNLVQISKKKLVLWRLLCMYKIWHVEGCFSTFSMIFSTFRLQFPIEYYASEPWESLDDIRIPFSLKYTPQKSRGQSNQAIGSPNIVHTLTFNSKTFRDCECEWFI